MQAFATVEQYMTRYGEVNSGDMAVLAETLVDASRKIAAKLDRAGIDWRDPDEDYAERLMQVCRDMAHRALSVDEQSGIPFGATQFTTSVDGFSEQVGFQTTGSSGFGELYITKSERELLGLNRARVMSVSPLGGAYHARR